MKPTPVILSLEKLKRWPALARHFTGKYVCIYAGEHQCWWRPDYQGYTTHVHEAGIFEFEEAWKHVRTCDKSKGIVLETADSMARRLTNPKPKTVSEYAVKHTDNCPVCSANVHGRAIVIKELIKHALNGNNIVPCETNLRRALKELHWLMELTNPGPIAIPESRTTHRQNQKPSSRVPSTVKRERVRRSRG